MRWTRPLLLLAILGIAAGVGTTFYSRLKERSADAPAKPSALAPGLKSSASAWDFTQSASGKPIVSVHADHVKQTADKYQLTGVELHIFQKDGTAYNKVTSASADFDISQGIMFSDGAVEITMGVPVDAAPSGRLMKIESSGVTFESKTGKASTDRPASFQFEQGDGKAVGATYDPQTGELHMKSQVELIWRGRDPNAIPMKIECDDLLYKEKESKVYLSPWSRLTRGPLTLNAGPAVVTLVDGIIDHVDTQQAHGTDRRPGRNLEYSADQLTVNLDENDQIQRIVGDRNAHLVSRAATGDTTITTDHIDLNFITSEDDSLLDTAVATGHSVAESKPAVKPGAIPAQTRVLRSDVIKTKMREGGQEIDNVETAGAGSLEFIPSAPTQPHRWMNGDRLWIQYGENNQLKSFRSINVATRTQKPKLPGAKENPPPALTWSKNLKADFNQQTSELARLEQWDAFRYEEGLRKAQADRAVLEQDSNRIHLTGSARIWDNTGTTDADKIDLDQNSGDFTAGGNVNSTRLPDPKPDSGSGGGMLSQDEPLHAKAKKMVSTDNNLDICYDGNAVAWQGANRLQADAIEIDRENSILKAHGHVISQLMDKKDKRDSASLSEGGNKAAAPVFTIVKAPDLNYNDEKRVAIYTGGAYLERSDVRVKARQIQAFLRDSSGDSSLDHAFADGAVKITSYALARTRTGTSEHAEYYVDESKVILEGGQPQMVDSLKGSTKGKKLTWYSNDDRLLVDGVKGDQAHSRIRRKQTP